MKVYELNGECTSLPTFRDMETVSGKVILKIKGKKFEHKGIKLELMGIIQGTKDPKDLLKFFSVVTDFESVGTLTTETNSYPFKFQNVQKQYETYRGFSKNVKYLLRLTIETTFKTLTYDQEFGVINPEPASVLETNNEPIKLEVGIDEWIHLAFDVEGRHFGLKDVAHGRVTFKKVGLRMESMEVQIIKKEIVNGSDEKGISTTIAKYEIMDGGPIKNEVVPIRFFFKPYNLTPTMNNINNKFSVQYILNLVLTDIENRKYFKNSEIFLHRIEKKKKEESNKDK